MFHAIPEPLQYLLWIFQQPFQPHSCNRIPVCKSHLYSSIAFDNLVLVQAISPRRQPELLADMSTESNPQVSNPQVPALQANSASTDAGSTLVLQMTEPAMLFDAAGRVLVMNGAAETLFQTKAGAVVGHTFDRFIPCPREYAGDVPRYIADFVTANPQLWSHPVTALCGTQTRLSLMVYRTALEQAGQTCALLFFQNISDSINGYRDLERRLTSAESLSAAKTQFLEHLNHEMRSPLALMLNVAGQLLDRTDLAADVRQEIMLAYQAGRELQKSQYEIADFTQLEGDNLEFESICFNIRYVLEDLLESFQDQANKKNLEFATLVAPSVPEYLIGDPNRVRQILQFLLNQAFRNTVEGGVAIKAQCLVETKHNATIEFEIDDTGLGMSEQRRKDVQALFDNPRIDFANRLADLGVGIAIAKELVDRMGGRLILRSAENVGSSFIVSLKFEKGEQLLHDQRVLAGKRILIVNDMLEDRGWLMDACKQERMKVEWVGAGNYALKTLMQENASLTPFDFLLIDLHELKMAGIHLAQEVRCQPTLKNVAIVMLVASNEGVTPAIASGMGVNVLLSKPLRKGLLMQSLRAALAQQRQVQPVLVTQHLLMASGDRRAQRALLVEDNEVNQIIAKGALRRLGITADVTNNGEEAIDAVRDNHYDFILMDCDMPVMDGFEATRIIREWEISRGERATIIALTASDGEECRQQCLEAGMDDFMQKPFRSDQLQAILDRIAKPGP